MPLNIVVNMVNLYYCSYYPLPTHTHPHTHTHTQPSGEGAGVAGAQLLSEHYLVELSAVTTSGHDNVGMEMRAFAEQLKPYPMEQL